MGTPPRGGSFWLQRLPLVAVVVVGVLLWRGACGLLPSERELVWRFPVSYGEVRKVELQVWDGDALLKREELLVPGGLTAEPKSKLTLTRGPHRALVQLWLAGASAPLSYTVEFDPRDEPTVVIAPRGN